MNLYNGMRVRTAISQGMINLLNFDLRNAHALLFRRDKGVKKPEMKNMVDITKISMMILTTPTRSFVAGS